MGLRVSWCVAVGNISALGGLHGQSGMEMVMCINLVISVPSDEK
jgi:hypothetical protein